MLRHSIFIPGRRLRKDFRPVGIIARGVWITSTKPQHAAVSILNECGGIPKGRNKMGSFNPYLADEVVAQTEPGESYSF